MKSLLSNLLLIGLTASLFVSCGEESNSTSSTFSSAGITNNSDINTIVSNLASQKSCQYGARLQVVSCPVYAPSGLTSVVKADSEVTCTTGGVSGVEKVYIGANNFNDLMVVSKVGTSYYVSVSMCPDSQQVMTSNRTVKSLRSYSGGFTIYLGDIVSNNTGSIVAVKDLYVKLSSYGYYSENYFGPTTFFDVTIQ